MNAFWIVRSSAANALADLKVVYTWRTWTFGLLVRMLAQVAFFSLIGVVVGADAEGMRFLVIGNAIMTCVIESMMVVASSSWERFAGTLPLLVAAPARLLWVFVGRSLQWPVSGSVTSLVSLLVIGPMLGAQLPWWRVPLLAVLVVLTAFSVYCVGVALGAVVLAASSLRNIVSNAAYLLMMAGCGVVVPTSFWPSWVGNVTSAIPLTHGLAAVRGLYEAQLSSAVLVNAGLAAATGALWLVAAHVLLRAFVRLGRSTGSVSFT